MRKIPLCLLLGEDIHLIEMTVLLNMHKNFEYHKALYTSYISKNNCIILTNIRIHFSLYKTLHLR